MYRNCGCLIPDSVRSDAKYCNKKCKGNEKTYLKRDMRRIKKEKEELVKNLIEVEKRGELIELFNKIYKR